MSLLYGPFSFAIILMGKRELVTWLNLSSWCPVIVVWLFLVVPWVCLQFVIVVFPDHAHLLFFPGRHKSRPVFSEKIANLTHLRSNLRTCVVQKNPLGRFLWQKCSCQGRLGGLF